VVPGNYRVSLERNSDVCFARHGQDFFAHMPGVLMAKQDVDCVLRRSFFLSFFLSFCVGEQPTWPRLTLGIGRSLLRQIVLSLLRDKLVSLLRKSPISEWLNCHVSFAKEPCFHRAFWRKESDAVPVLHNKPCPGRIVVDRTSIIADTAAA